MVYMLEFLQSTNRIKQDRFKGAPEKFLKQFLIKLAKLPNEQASVTSIIDVGMSLANIGIRFLDRWTSFFNKERASARESNLLKSFSSESTTQIIAEVPVAIPALEGLDESTTAAFKKYLMALNPKRG